MADSKSQNRHTYIPPHVQQQMSKQLQQTVPKHMQQYVGAFMEQNVVNPHLNNPMVTMSAPGKMTGQPQAYRPVTHLPRQSHYNNQFREPGTATGDLYSAANPAPTQPTQPVQPVQPAQTEQYGHYPTQPQPAQHQPYEFIMNPEPKPKHRLPGTNSLLARVGLAAGGLIILLVAFSALKGLLAGPSPYPYFVSVAQEQQALIHLVTEAQDQPDLSTTNLNFAATAELSLTTSQSKTIEYLTNNHKKVDGKQLNLKIDKKLDDQLTTAAAATTYNQTFQEIMQTQLTNYMSNLNTAYAKASGQKGRQLLHDNYKQAQLLQQQLQAADAAPIP